MEINVEIANVYLDDDGICRFKFDASATNHFTKKQAYELIDALFEACQGKPTPLLIDGRDVIGIVDQDARFLMRNSEKMLQIRKAEAFLVNSRRNKIIALFYIFFNRPPNPAKIFTDEDEALTWLRDYL